MISRRVRLIEWLDLHDPWHDYGIWCDNKANSKEHHTLTFDGWLEIEARFKASEIPTDDIPDWVYGPQ